MFKAKSMNEVDAGRNRGSSKVKTVNEEEEEDQWQSTSNAWTDYRRDTARAINSAHKGDTSAGASLNTA